MDPLEVRNELELTHDSLRAVEALDAPVIAALEGHVLGGGPELALACEIRVASETAEFGLPESEMGLAMDLGGLQKLPSFAGEGLMNYLVTTSERIDAQRAHDTGLVEAVHRTDAFESAVEDLERTLAAKPTSIHGLAKRQAHSVRPDNLDDVMQQAIHHAVAAYNEPETQERVEPFFSE